MKFLKLIALFCLFVVSSCVKTRQEEPTAEAVPKLQGHFFVSAALSSEDCVAVDLGNQVLWMELDLGFNGDLILAAQDVAQISPKTFLSTKSMYGMRGTEYQSDLYRLPAIEIGAMGFTNPILQVEGSEFIKESTLSTYHEREHPGRLGWELFYNVNLLLNFQGREIAFCDSFDTLQKEGYFAGEYVAAPLLLEKGLLELEVNTLGQSLRCVLDTGATHNFLNKQLTTPQTMEEAFQDPENTICDASLKIAEHEFGPVTFHQIPINLPIHIDAILGMEFIREHLIFLDFERQSLYIQ